jgi:hypothetical protein
MAIGSVMIWGNLVGSFGLLLITESRQISQQVAGKPGEIGAPSRGCIYASVHSEKKTDKQQEGYTNQAGQWQPTVTAIGAAEVRSRCHTRHLSHEQRERSRKSIAMRKERLNSSISTDRFVTTLLLMQRDVRLAHLQAQLGYNQP